MGVKLPYLRPGPDASCQLYPSRGSCPDLRGSGRRRVRRCPSLMLPLPQARPPRSCREGASEPRLRPVSCGTLLQVSASACWTWGRRLLAKREFFRFHERQHRVGGSCHACWNLTSATAEGVQRLVGARSRSWPDGGLEWGVCWCSRRSGYYPTSGRRLKHGGRAERDHRPRPRLSSYPWRRDAPEVDARPRTETSPRTERPAMDNTQAATPVRRRATRIGESLWLRRAMLTRPLLRTIHGLCNQMRAADFRTVSGASNAAPPATKYARRLATPTAVYLVLALASQTSGAQFHRCPRQMSAMRCGDNAAVEAHQGTTLTRGVKKRRHAVKYIAIGAPDGVAL